MQCISYQNRYAHIDFNRSKSYIANNVRQSVTKNTGRSSSF